MNNGKIENKIQFDNSAIKIQIITSLTEVEKYRELWNDLVLQTDTPSPLLIYEWFETWWQCFASKNKSLYIILLWKNEELLCIAPLMKVKINRCGIKINKIEFISMMSTAYSAQNIAGYLDFIIKKGHHQECLDIILRHLKGLQKDWDYIRLHPILSTSNTLNTIQNLTSNNNFIYHRRRVFYSSKVIFDFEWNNYTNKLNKDFLKKIFSREKKLKQSGILKLIEINDSKNVDEIFEKIVEIDKNSWKTNKGMQINDARYKNFYKTLISNFCKKGYLYIAFLNHNSINIVYDIIVHFTNISISLKTSYDAKYQKYGVGNILTLYNMKKMFDNGIKEFHLLWGNVGAKSVWNPIIEQYDEIFLFNKRLKSRLLYFIYHKLYLYRLMRFIRYKYFKG